MKKFRVAKCVENGMINEYAIFEDNSKKIINKDYDGNKYFYVDNEILTNIAGNYKTDIFTNRIKDAIDTIKNGDGDLVDKVYNPKGNDIKVLYYIDRSVAKLIRNNILKKFENTEFGWTIAFKLPANSINKCDVRITKKYKKISNFDNLLNYAFFDTYEEAESFAKKIIEISRKYTDDVISGKSIKDVRSEIKREYGSGSIISDLAIISTGGFPSTQIKSLFSYEYEIVQCIKHTKEKILDFEFMSIFIKTIGLYHDSNIDFYNVINFMKCIYSKKENEIDLDTLLEIAGKFNLSCISLRDLKLLCKRTLKIEI